MLQTNNSSGSESPEQHRIGTEYTIYVRKGEKVQIIYLYKFLKFLDTLNKLIFVVQCLEGCEIQLSEGWGEEERLATRLEFKV